MKRNKSIVTFVATMVAMLSVSLSFAESVMLTTSQGKLEGSTSPANEKIHVYKSIPYAKPPVGERRWTHAEPAGNWQGRLLATQFSPSCMQHPYPEGTFFSRSNLPSSEDCLYLNVWSGAAKGEKRPVMVWIHGGGLTRGSGSTQSYDGTALAEKGVVVVTINYRLDIFGYFSHPQLVDPESGKSTANFGTSDQVVALQWVKKTIAEYGGDPDNVTIFGESAGSFSVHHMMATPSAKGLFHRAIGQSGSSFRAFPDLREKDNAAHTLAVKYQKSAGASSLAELKTMDASDILKTATGYRFRPVVDGTIFPDQVYSLFEKGLYNSVPLMVGFNEHEGTTLGAGGRVPKDKASYRAKAEKQYGALTEEYLQLYPDTDLYQSTLNVFRDGFATWGMQSWAMMMESSGNDAYLYYFTFHPAGPKLGAYHAAEIVYAFNNVGLVRENAGKDHIVLADSMSDYWVAFAKTGNPDASNLPIWKPYTKKNRHYIDFNQSIVPGTDLLPGVWEFHEKVRLQKP